MRIDAKTAIKARAYGLTLKGWEIGTIYKTETNSKGKAVKKLVGYQAKKGDEVRQSTKFDKLIEGLEMLERIRGEIKTMPDKFKEKPGY